MTDIVGTVGPNDGNDKSIIGTRNLSVPPLPPLSAMGLPTPSSIDPVAEAAKASIPFVPIYQNVILTPKVANDLLVKKFKNRRILKAHLTYLANKMNRGEWRLNAECIAFDPSGNLLNGQNRLAACVQANESIPVTLAFNVDPDTVVTMDTGKVRNLGEVLGAMGLREDMSSPLKFFYQFRQQEAAALAGKPLPRKDKPSTEQFIDLLSNEPAFEHSTTPARKVTRALAGISGPAVHAAHYLTMQDDPGNAVAFWNGIATGTGLADTDVRYQFREWHNDRMRRHPRDKKPDAAWYFVALMRAWKLYLKGKPAKKQSTFPRYDRTKGLLAF